MDLLAVRFKTSTISYQYEFEVHYDATIDKQNKIIQSQNVVALKMMSTWAVIC